MKNSSVRSPLFYTQTGTPFVFWDDADSALAIRHGARQTLIYYRPTSDPTITRLNLNPSSMKEEYIYSNGRIVASYLPAAKMAMICRDGDIFGFEYDKPAFGYKNIKEFGYVDTDGHTPLFMRATLRDSAIRRMRVPY